MGNLLVNASNPSTGLLIDLDIAARVDGHGNPANDGILPPAGTLECRAYELIVPKRPEKALYRHDLESFFYTLLWIEALYEDGKIKVNPEEAIVGKFRFRHSWDAVRGCKLGFLVSHNDQRLQPSPSKIAGDWNVRLHQLFGRALNARTEAFIQARDGGDTLLDEETLGGMLTFKTFMNVLTS